ncbi:hypothetical protein BGZ54_008676 [Gamsiella multidivaricata]|nr:hypothetical protein BGZ54_008676 [Gamsiella multidivaricata]
MPQPSFGRKEHDHTLHKQGHCRIENSLCDYDAVEIINREMREQLQALVQQKYFRFYKLNLYGTCPFWTENHLCTNKDCGVAVIDERSVPEKWTGAALGAISSPTNGMLFQPFKSCQLKDQDFCQVDDEAVSQGVYVDLMENPERFTGYSGPSAAKVWDAIYNENCFNIAQRMQQESDCEQCSLDHQANKETIAGELRTTAATGVSLAKNSLAAPESGWSHPGDRLERMRESSDAGSDSHGVPPSSTSAASESMNALTAGASQDEEACLEKRVFYRMISGLHASISIHICDEHFNRTSGVWGPNLECFVSRVGAHPDRLENIYFDYAILVRAVTKLSGYLKDYQFCTGNPEEDTKVKVGLQAMVDSLINTSSKSPAVFDEKAMFVGPGAQALKLEFRDHFRNVSKIMDCVGCEKCRLWGKVQTSGLGTALKVLFSYNDEFLNPTKNPNLLQRTEIVALFNTFNRLSESVESIVRFREMFMEDYQSQRKASTAPAPTSERQQHPLESGSMPTGMEEQIQPMPLEIWPFITSVLERHLDSIVARGSSSSPRHPTHSPHSTRAHSSSAEAALRHVQEWMWTKSSDLTDLVLKIYRNPMPLFYGERIRTKSHPSG